MISADTGGSPNVTGSSMAIVAVGPEAGQHADRGAEKDADEAIEEIREGECRLCANPEKPSSSMVSFRSAAEPGAEQGIGTPRPLANTSAQNTTRTTSAPTAFHSNLKKWLAAALTRHSATRRR